MTREIVSEETVLQSRQTVSVNIAVGRMEVNRYLRKILTSKTSGWTTNNTIYL